MRCAKRTWGFDVMPLNRRDVLLSATALIAASAHSQSAPARILVGAPAGGSTDTLARALAQELGRLLGKVVVVENRPGAGGNIADRKSVV